MAYFLFRLLPPRPTFQADMTVEERQVMIEHVQYWTGLLKAGKVVAFGPVADPKGGWGVGIVEAADADDARLMADADPAIRSGRGFRTEVLPILQLVRQQ